MSKKKTEASKKDAPDDTTERLYRFYRRNLAEYNLQIPRKIEEKFSEIRDEKNPGRLTEFIIWEEIGSAGIRAFSDALRETEYQHLKSVRLWKAACEDEGLRALTQYMRQVPNISTLECIECNISPLGCEFVGELLSPDIISMLQVLKLDYNNFGELGVANISRGLRRNTMLQNLSMAFCGIGPEGGRYLLEIIINENSSLEEINVEGNMLANEGCWNVFHGLEVNNSLVRINLSDNQINEEESLIDKIHDFLANNKSVEVLDLRFNEIGDFAAGAVVDMFKNEESLNSTINTIVLPENKVSEELEAELERLIGGNKRGKKGKRGGGKKKKKKK